MAQEFAVYPWFQAFWQAFIAQQAEGRLHHANLLVSREGIGLDPLMEAMATYLLCRHPLATTACGQCKSCLLRAAGSHPDVFYVMPEEGAQGIKIAQVRDLVPRLNASAQQGGAKIVLLSPAEALNTEAANALLKSLEEPTADTFFIVATYQSARLLPTLRSRMVQQLLPGPSLEVATQWLHAQNKSEAIASLPWVEGAPLAAIAWYENGRQAAFDRCQQALESFLTGQTPLHLALKEWDSLEIQDLLSWIQSWLLQARRQQLDPSLAPSGVASFVKLPAQGLYSLWDLAGFRQRQCRSGANPNRSLLLEEFLVLCQQALGAR